MTNSPARLCVLAVRLATTFCLCLTGCNTSVQGGLTEEQANRILVGLAEHQIPATKEPQGSGDEMRYRVVVASADSGRALSAMAALGLPGRPEPGFEEVFARSGLVPTPIEEQAKFISALCGELARSIEAMDGVRKARVHVGMPRSDELGSEASARARASVLVKFARAPTAEDERAIRALVAGAIHTMTPSDVAVVSVRASRVPQPKAQWAYFGPLAVARASAPLLQWMIAVGLGTNLLLVGLLIALIWNHRKQRR